MSLTGQLPFDPGIGRSVVVSADDPDYVRRQISLRALATLAPQYLLFNHDLLRFGGLPEDPVCAWRRQQSSCSVTQFVLDEPLIVNAPSSAARVVFAVEKAFAESLIRFLGEIALVDHDRQLFWLSLPQVLSITTIPATADVPVFLFGLSGNKAIFAYDLALCPAGARLRYIRRPADPAVATKAQLLLADGDPVDVVKEGNQNDHQEMGNPVDQ